MLMSTRKARRKALYVIQPFCHREWGCGVELPLEGLQECHLTNLGMGANRNNDSDPRNALSNRVLLCASCHINQETIVRAMRDGWAAGKNDWVEPRSDNFREVWVAVEAGLSTQKGPDSRGGEEPEPSQGETPDRDRD